MRKGAALAAALLGSAAFAAAGDYALPEAPASHVEFSSDQLDFSESSSIMHLKGHVLLQDATWTVRADDLWINSETRTAWSPGFLFLDDGYGALRGTEGNFDLRTHEGWLAEPQTGYGDWSVKADLVRAGKGHELTYQKASFSGCNEKPPHYHLYSGRLRVVPKKYLLAYNTVFYIGPIPVLYLPVFYTPLRDFRFWDSRLHIGYDRRNGVFVKTNFEQRWSDSLYSKVFLDGYTKQGFGIGGEAFNRKGEGSRGGFYAYHIKEASTGDNRWVVIADQYQTLTSSLSAQVRAQLQSDAEFNNHYARSKDFRVTPELVNSAALTYSLPRATARLSLSRLDQDDGSRRRYIKTSESLPRLDIQSAALRLGRLPWINTLSFFAENNDTRARGFQQKTVGASWQATNSVRLARTVSFTPAVGYGQTYYDRVDALTSFASTQTLRDAFIGRYFANGNLRATTRVGAWDLKHSYQVRQKPGSFEDDAGAVDHGVEANLLSLQDTFRPARRVLVRLRSGYDFRVFRDRYLGFRQRVQPIVTEASYSPRVDLSFAIRNDIQLKEGDRAFLFNGTYGDPAKDFVSASIGYTQAHPGSTFANLAFSWEPSSSGWRLGGGLATEWASLGGFSGLRTVRLFEKELSVAKRLHDFDLRAIGRLRPGGVREFSFRVEMRFPGTRKAQIAKKDWEAEWFPERRYGFDDRP